jgi:hypothetical protein
MHFATFEVIPMRRDHRMLSQPVAVVAFILAFAAPAGAADLLPYEEGCGYECGAQPYANGAQPYANGAQPYANGAQPYDGQAYGGQPYGGQPYGPYGGQPYAGGQPYGAQPYGGQPYAGGQPYGAEPYGGQPYGGQPYAAPAIDPDNGYGPPEEQYDEPIEQGDGSPVY